MGREKVIYIEVLRIIAMISVVLLHITSTAWYYVEVNTVDWNLYNAIRCFCKWGVTVFVMISGVNFMTKQEIPLKDLWGKYIKRIAIILTFWSFVYAFIPVLRILFREGKVGIERLFEAVCDFILGENHLWYLYMCIGLYMMIPFMKEIAKRKEILQYYIILSIVFTIFIPGLEHVSWFRESIWKQLLDKFSIQMVIGYSCYFLLGYYWSTVHINLNKRCVLYVMGIGWLLGSIYLTSISEGKHFLVDGTMSIGNFFITNAIFVFVKYILKRVNISKKITEKINLIASYSLGIYLVHMFFVRIITKWGINWFDNALMVTGIAFCGVLICSCIVCIIIKRVPGINRTI